MLTYAKLHSILYAVKPVEIFELELYSDTYTTTLKLLQSDRITRTNLETPIIASEVTFRVPPFYQYQFQVYGSEDSIGKLYNVCRLYNMFY